ncbi:Zinc finger, C2H2 [Plasmopara halstedii]|uniref:Zinc finger, C2H2 n=1 Tax=Plasmopara halstedii TaxID=4781 RepID=A0A0N7L610_PLAHL|nr:Zinc finger, C2H2 [Plasmopara halstedii]CEG42971.1 Zinc finger, C2H2 [Plasmopara halstedii]|eukprot:XP_024579340.1 Zinc finger, C2H2 [Plasmopara halstedii]
MREEHNGSSLSLDENDELTEFYPLDEESSQPQLEEETFVSTQSSMENGGSWTTSRDQIALQLFWQGYDAYVVCKEKESVAPCFYNAQCVGQTADNEFVQIVPVDGVHSRHILDDMRVHLVSVSSGKSLRASSISKYLKWSRSRDQKTMFVIQIGDRKPLSSTSKFTLTSCFWPDHSIGFTQNFPLGGGREVSKAIGFLTLEKRKNQPPLLFPIRFRAVQRSVRDDRGSVAPRYRQPTPFITATEMLFIGEDEADIVSDIPLARVTSPPPSGSGSSGEHDASTSSRLSSADDEIWENCTFCSRLFRARSDLIAHIRDTHGEILHRVSVPGTFCIRCGTRRDGGSCSRCASGT